MGPWSMVYLGVAIVIIVIIVARRWLFEESGTPFLLPAGIICAVISDLLLASVFCSYKIGLVAGLVGGLAGGYFIGNMVEGGG